jgi:hypothetical protein
MANMAKQVAVIKGLNLLASVLGQTSATLTEDLMGRFVEYTLTIHSGPVASVVGQLESGG